MEIVIIMAFALAFDRLYPFMRNEYRHLYYRFKDESLTLWHLIRNITAGTVSLFLLILLTVLMLDWLWKSAGDVWAYGLFGIV